MQCCHYGEKSLVQLQALSCAGNAGSSSTRQWWNNRFCVCDPARVTMLGAVSRQAYLAAHADVDLILDTFPYPGGTTTCEALWMGVPTLTLSGDSLLARQGASLLTAAGLEEWIATSESDYIDKAMELVDDLDKLAALRAGLREQMRASPLFDAKRFARNFEDALWGMWHSRAHHNMSASGRAS